MQTAGPLTFRATLVLILLPVLLAQTEADRQRLEAARLARQQGQAQIASKGFEAILPAFRTGKDRLQYARVLVETAQVAVTLGEYPRAISLAGEAAGIFKESGERKSEASAVNTVGLSRLYRGEYPAALDRFHHALQIARDLKDPSGEIMLLNNIGNVFYFQGRYLDALQSYEQAIGRLDQNVSQPWNPRRRQLTFANLATLYEQLGQNEKALDFYKQAQAFGSVLPPAEYAQLLSNLGTLYRRLGDPVKALDAYAAADGLFVQQKHSDGAIHVLENIGIVHALDYGDLPRALESFAAALKLAKATSNRRQTVLAELFRAEALYRMNRLPEAELGFEAGLSGAQEIGGVEERWTALSGLGRIRLSRGDVPGALDAFRKSIATIESVRTGLSRSSLKTEFLANKRDVYDSVIDAYLRSGGSGQEELFRLFEKARSRNLQDTLANSMPEASLRSVQERLGERSILVEYWLGSGQMAALWIRRNSSGVVTRRLAAAERDRIQALIETLPDARDQGWRSDAERASQVLLGGIPLSGEVESVLIVPDGSLYRLPFELLPLPGSGLLIERLAVSYLPSAALLLRPAGRRRAAPPWQGQLLAFGDPMAPAAGVLSGEQAWSRLPDSARELKLIAAALHGGAELHAGQDNLKRLLFQARQPPAPLLHFSTHAAVDMMDPNRSRILFTPESGNRGSEYLFWREVQGLALRGVELVTLSACDTEGGKIVRGEGIQSFSRAFLSAGADATLTTLWRVADRPTADFMKLFYLRLAKGDSKAQALRAAKLSFLRSGQDLAQPRYWAAFVLNGDGQTPVRLFVSWWWPSLAGALLAAGITAWACRRQYRRL